MMSKQYIRILTILLCHLIIGFHANGQAVIKEKLFSRFLENTDTSLIILGENHSSSVASTIYPQLIRKLNEKNELNSLLIEFGPSEAYFYSQFLTTGEEKFLNYTIYAGYYTDWNKAWKEIYRFNQTLSEPLQITGIDFDRARTFAYALYNIFKAYPERPHYIDSLMHFVRQDSFYTNYTNGYPTTKDKAFTARTKALLKKHREELASFLNPYDFDYVSQMMDNQCTGFNDAREQELYHNTIKAIRNSKKTDFLLLIGRDHAYLNAIYDDDPRLATMIRELENINLLTGLILHENSQQWGNNYEKAITLFEVKDKIPWKDYYTRIQRKARKEISVIPLKRRLKQLAFYTDYLIIARNQPPIAF